MFRNVVPRVYSAIRSATASAVAEDFAPLLDAGILEDRILFNAALPVDGAVEGDAGTADPSGGWLLEEDYSGTTADLHDSLSGSWDVVDGEFVATPGSDAITTLQFDQSLPSNLELFVTINADDASGQYLSNAFVIFDYHSPDDFKFAGAYMGVDQWVIGHRTASDWVTDTWVSAPVHPLTDYNLGVRITSDSQIMLSVDGMSVLTHTYAGDSLTDGDLGLGTKNAVARFDDLRVRSLLEDTAGSPGELTLVDDFDDYEAEHFAPESGTWFLVDGHYEVSPTLSGDGASVMLLSGDVPDDVEVGVSFDANDIIPYRFSNGVIIFDYHSPTDFKFAGGFINRDQWVIGQRTDAGWVDTIVMPTTLDALSSYDVKLVIQNGTDVTLHAGGQAVLSHSFTESVTDGALGLGSNNAVTRFDNFSVVDLTPAPEPVPEPTPEPEPEPVSTILAEMVDRELVISGEAVGQLQIVAYGRDDFRIMDDTGVLYEFENVRGDLRIQLSDGDDYLKLDMGGHKFKHDVVVNMGEGTNDLQVVNGKIAGRLTVHGGSGQDNLTLGNDLYVRRHAVVDLGDGENHFHVAGAELDGHLKYEGGADLDNVTIADGAKIDGHAVVKLGDGANHFDLANARVDGHLWVHGGDHVDAVTIGKDALVRKHVWLVTGAGEDSILFGGKSRGLFVHAGHDDDMLELTGVVSIGVWGHMGDGDDQVKVAEDANLGRVANFRLGDGDDSFTNAKHMRRLIVNGGAGNDTIDVPDSPRHHNHRHHRHHRWV